MRQTRKLAELIRNLFNFKSSTRDFELCDVSCYGTATGASYRRTAAWI
jgi:hypothetical protein